MQNPLAKAGAIATIILHNNILDAEINVLFFDWFSGYDLISDEVIQAFKCPCRNRIRFDLLWHINAANDVHTK